jgi:CRISPR-associated endonuclease/helicase Cas3
VVVDDDGFLDRVATRDAAADRGDDRGWVRQVRRVIELPPALGGGVILIGPRAEREADELDEARETVLVAAGTTVLLSDHSRGVADRAGRFAHGWGLSAGLVKDVTLAGALHDIGKADPRCQLLFHGGDRLAAEAGAGLLAKSRSDPRDHKAREAALVRSGWPRGMRHEMVSVQVVLANPGLLEGAEDRELVIYLIGTHHGKGRPWWPPVHDPAPPAVAAELDLPSGRRHVALDAVQRTEINLWVAHSGWPELFARMTDKYGWWGLARLEAILRLADWSQSAAERRS